MGWDEGLGAVEMRSINVLNEFGSRREVAENLDQISTYLLNA